MAYSRPLSFGRLAQILSLTFVTLHLNKCRRWLVQLFSRMRMDVMSSQ